MYDVLIGRVIVTRTFASCIFIVWLTLCQFVLALEGTELEPYSAGSRAFSGALQTTTNKTITRGVLTDSLQYSHWISALSVVAPRLMYYLEGIWSNFGAILERLGCPKGSE